jgi:CubicO group peptidase (beta-lactamase class C family)
MKSLKCVVALVILCFNCSSDLRETDQVAVSAGNDAPLVLPDSNWQSCEPGEQGFSRVVIDSIGEIMKMNNANGVLTRNGLLVGEWLFGGESSKKFDSQSVSKSITSMALGLALRDGLLGSIDDYVVDYYPDFSCGEYSDSITFRQLVTNTSGIALTRWTHQRNPGWMKPGLESHYHNDHWTELARALTYVFGKPLKQVLEKNVLGVIGAEMDWWLDSMIGNYVKGADGDSIEVNAGYAYTCWTARDLARVGLLYLNRGAWDGQQVLPEDYVRESWTEIPQPLGSRRPDTTSARRAFSPSYGLGWWTIKGSGIWTMSGNGGQFCMVIPKYNIVMTKVNDYRIDRAQQIRSSAFLPLVLEAMGEDMSELRELMQRMKARRSSRSK